MRIFISHIHEEARLARQLREALDQDFHGVLDIFVSSHENSVASGDKWLERIQKGIPGATVLMLCSHESFRSRWLHIEAGGAFLHNQEVIPVCHGRFTADDLEAPYSSRTAVSLTPD